VDAPALRPLAVGEVLDVAIKIYRAHFLTLVKTVLVVVAPLQVLTVLVQVSSRPSPEQLTTVGPNGQPQVHFGAFRTVIAGTFVVVVLSFAVSQLAAAASFKAVSTAYLGETPSWRASLRFAVSKLHSLLWLALMSITLAVLALFLCIVPGVYLWGSWLVASPVLLFEGVRGRRALGRSRMLVRGRWWPTVAATLVGLILASVVTGVVTALVAGISLSGGGSDTVAKDALRVVAGSIGSAVTTPFTAAVVAVIYFDLRVRKEGFDLQLLADRIGVEPTTPMPAYLPPPPPVERPGDQPPFWPPPPGWRPTAPRPPDPPAGG